MAKQQGTQTGVIETWKLAEGFGFIQPNGGGKDHFFHKSEIIGRQTPAVGQRVSYTVGRDAKGRFRAENITIEGKATVREQVKGQTKGRLGLPDLPGGLQLSKISSTHMVLFALPFLFATLTLSWIPLALYTITSLVGFGAITLDKRFAQANMWRIPEATLHLIEILGGWSGSGLAQQIVRHKTQKTSYQITFWVIVILHLVIGIDYFFFGLTLSKLIADMIPAVN